jgi:hypothetical protein
LCALINQHLSGLARKFPDVKFVKAISTTCIPNYPDKNLPTIFVYLGGDIKAQFIGPLVFGGMNLTRDGKGFWRWVRGCERWEVFLLKRVPWTWQVLGWFVQFTSASAWVIAKWEE